MNYAIKSRTASRLHFESEIAEDLDKRDYIVSNAKIKLLASSPNFLEMGIAERLRFIRCYQ